MAEAKLAAAWPGAAAAKQRVCDARSMRTAAAAAAGLEALAKLHEDGREPHAATLERLKRELRDGVDSIDLLFSALSGTYILGRGGIGAPLAPAAIIELPIPAAQPRAAKIRELAVTPEPQVAMKAWPGSTLS